MRLVQKNLRHTGYAILEVQNEDGCSKLIEPLFTEDFLLESTELREELEKNLGVSVKLLDIYGANIDLPLQQLKEFKQNYGALPRNYTEEIRTGFQHGDGLTQYYPRFIYK